MGLRFRKSFKLGPVRVNLSKSGIGYSYGVKGFRVTHKATGGTRTTVSVPGTGISYVTETSANKSMPSEKNIQKAGTQPPQKNVRDTETTRQVETIYLPDKPEQVRKTGQVETIYLNNETKPTSEPVHNFTPKRSEQPEERYATIADSRGTVRRIKYIKCPMCSRDMLETSKVCSYCSGGKNGYSSNSYRDYNASSYTHKRKKSKALLIVAALVAVGVGIGALGGGDDEIAPIPQMSVQEAIQLVEGGGANIPTIPTAMPEGSDGDVVAVTPGGINIKDEVTDWPTPTEAITEMTPTQPATEPKTDLIPTQPATEQQTEAVVKNERIYIGNSGTKKFHYQSCSSADEISPKNRVEITGRDTAINQGYVPCKRCSP